MPFYSKGIKVFFFRFFAIEYKRPTFHINFCYKDKSCSHVCFCKGGLKKTDIIERALIDAAVPFLPLEKRHVMLCIQAEIDKHNLVDHEEESRPVKDYTEDDLSALADLRSYDKEGVFR